MLNDGITNVNMKTSPWPQWTGTNELILLGSVYIRQEERKGTNYGHPQTQMCQPPYVHPVWRASTHT